MVNKLIHLKDKVFKFENQLVMEGGPLQGFVTLFVLLKDNRIIQDLATDPALCLHQASLRH